MFVIKIGRRERFAMERKQKMPGDAAFAFALVMRTSSRTRWVTKSFIQEVRDSRKPTIAMMNVTVSKQITSFCPYSTTWDMEGQEGDYYNADNDVAYLGLHDDCRTNHTDVQIGAHTDV